MHCIYSICVFFLIFYIHFLSRCSFLYRFRFIIFVFIACLLTCKGNVKVKKDVPITLFKYQVSKVNFFLNLNINIKYLYKYYILPVILIWACVVTFYICTLLFVIMHDVMSSQIILVWKLLNIWNGESTKYEIILGECVSL